MIAGLSAAILWSIGSMLIGLIHEKDVNSRVMQAFRLPVTFVFLLLSNWVITGLPWTVDITPTAWGWLLTSGAIGLALGDIFLFGSYRYIGPRLGMLLMVCAPLFSALLAWLFLGEGSTPTQLVGMGITLGGVAWVISDRNSVTARPEYTNYGLGVLFGFLAAAGQGIGAFMTRLAFETGDISALNATLVRIIGGIGAMLVILLFYRELTWSYKVLYRERRASLLLLVTVFFGPFIGVWLSSVAFKTTHLGVASTLLALPPVFMIPIGYYVFNEKISWQSIIGTLIAICGVAILFLA